MRNCDECPSFVPAHEVPIVFGKSSGTPMCKRYGYALGRPGLSETGGDRLRESFALKCPSFGEAAPERPEEMLPRIGNPDQGIIDKAGDPDFQPSDLASCRRCTNLVGAEVVAEELGFPLDLCKAKGKLIFRPQSECHGCPFAMEGQMSTSTDGVDLRPEYKEGFVVPTAFAVKSVTSLGNTQAEPTTYISDAPVSDNDREEGIMAWRKLVDPNGRSAPIYLPIFDRKSPVFTDDEQSLIPATGDNNHPELYIDFANLMWDFAVNSYMLKETIALESAPGLGKTAFGYFMGWLMQLPVRRFSFTTESDVEDMLGAPQYKPEVGTYFELGRIPIAYQRPGIVIYDELNLAPTAIREALRPTFDNTKQLVLDQAKPAVYVPPHEYFYSIIAENPAHDSRNVGTSQFALADADRLTPIVVPLPPDAVERHIIATHCKLDGYDIPTDLLNKIMSIAEDIREQSSQGTIPFTWGIRQQIKAARKTRYYGLVDAFKKSALNFYEEETTAVVLQAIADRDAPPAKPEPSPW